MTAIKGSGGIISTIQKNLGCDSWITANAYINKWESTKRALQDEREKINDMCESSLLKSIQSGNTQDCKWYLSKKAKDRGFGDEAPVVNVTNAIPQNTESIKKNLDRLTPEERDLYIELCEKLNVADSE